MISVDEALATYANVLLPLPIELAATTEAQGRVLREPAIATVDLPRFDQSAMDGYAYAHAHHQPAMPCVGRAEAGHAPAAMQPGTCVRILTGAPMPAGADTVVAQEHVTQHDGAMCFAPADKPGRHVRLRGEELQAGTVLMDCGAVISAGAVAALCVAGVARLAVTRRPRIAVLVTGDEVQPVGQPLGDAQTFDANGPMIVAWLAQRGLRPALVQSVGDTAEAVDAALAAAADSDFVITTGGASVGDRDFIPDAVRRAGYDTHFWKVAQKPGKPLLFASRGHQALLALPGNPAAVLVGLHVHAATVLNVLAAIPSPGPAWQTAVWAQPPDTDKRRDRFVRVIARTSGNGTLQVEPVSHQLSHMISNLVSANALARVRSGSDSESCKFLPME